MTTPEHGEHSQGVGTAPVVGETPGIWDTTQARRFRAGATGAFFLLGLFDSMLGVVWPSMRSHLQLPIDALGSLLLGATVGFLVSSSASGWLLRRSRLAPILIAGTEAQALASATIGAGFNFASFVACFVCLGLCSGLIQAALSAAVSLWGPNRLMNALHGSYGAGAAVAPSGRDGIRTWPLVVAARLLLARRLSDPHRATLVGTPPARRGDPCGPTGDELTTASPRPEAFLGTRAAHVLLHERRRDGGRVVDGELPRGSLAAAGGRHFRSRGVLLLGRIGRLAPDCPRSVGTSTPPVSCWQASSSSSAGSAAVWAAPRCWLRHRQPGTARVRDRTSAAGAHEPDATTCRHDPSDWSDRQAVRRRQPGRLHGCSACAGFVLQHEGFSATGPVLTGFALVLTALLAVMHRAPTFEVPAGIGGGS